MADTHDMPMSVFPGYLAGPGDHAEALASFLTGRDEWRVHQPNPHSTVVVHEDMTTVLTLDHGTTTGSRWTIASYAHPYGRLQWRAQFCVRTPAEVVIAVVRRLAYALSQPTDEARDALLWEYPAIRGYEEQIEAEIDEASTRWASSGDTTKVWTHEALDGTAGLTTRGFFERPGSTDADLVFTVWAGPSGREDEHWRAEFSRFAPPAVIIAALRTVTRPALYQRRASRIPMGHRAQLRTHPVSRPRPRQHGDPR